MATPRQRSKPAGGRAPQSRGHKHAAPATKASKDRKAKVKGTIEKKLAAFHDVLAPTFDKTINNMAALANGGASPFHDTPNDVEPGSIPPKKKRGKSKTYVPNDDGGGQGEPEQAFMPAQSGRFKDDFEAVLEMSRAEGEEFSADAMALRLYKLLASMLINLIPLAEDRYIKTRSESSMYAMSSALNGLKDLTDLIRTHSTQDQRVETLISSIISPMFLHLAQHLIVSSGMVKSAIDDLKTLKPKDRDALKKSVTDMVTHHATYLDAQREATVERTRELLVPHQTPAKTVKPKGKKKKSDTGE